MRARSLCYALLLLMVALTAMLALAWPYTVDDAYIVARYARRIASGLGYSMNPGAPTDGVTGPLWLLPGVLAAWAGASPIAIAKLAGALAALVTCVRAVRLASAPALGTRAALACTLMLACMPDVTVWAVAGLETGLAMLIATELAAVLLRPRHEARILPLVCAAASVWLRPELAVYVLVICLGLLHVSPRAGRFALAGALLGAASVAVFRLWMFGELLPLSASAKPAALGQGGAYVLRGIVLSTSLVGCALAVLGARGGGARRQILLCAIGLHCLAVTLAGGDWMPGARLLVPVLPGLLVLAARGFALLSRERHVLAAAALGLTVCLPAIDLVTRIPELRQAGAARESSGRALAEHLRQRTRRVALLDIGFLGYASGVEVIDLGGLTDPVIGRARGGHIDKRIEPAYLQARAPDALLVHSRTPPRVAADGRLLAFSGYPVEHRVAAMPPLASMRVEHVSAYAQDYFYVLLTRSSAAEDAR